MAPARPPKVRTTLSLPVSVYSRQAAGLHAWCGVRTGGRHLLLLLIVVSCAWLFRLFWKARTLGPRGRNPHQTLFLRHSTHTDIHAYVCTLMYEAADCSPWDGLAARRRRDSGMIHAFCLAAPERCAVARGLMATLSAHVVAAMQAEHRRLVVSLPTRFSASMSQ